MLKDSVKALLNRLLIGLLGIWVSGCGYFTVANQPSPVVVSSADGECPTVSQPECPETPPSNTVASLDCPVEVPQTIHALIGSVEYVDLLSYGIRQKGRIDTGAETTSIDARNITLFERDGKRWVEFTLVDRFSGDAAVIRKKLERWVRIKQQGEAADRRPVVVMHMAVGELKQLIEVTLVNRQAFEYPVLIGRNFLNGNAWVDVSRKYLALEKPEQAP